MQSVECRLCENYKSNGLGCSTDKLWRKKGHRKNTEINRTLKDIFLKIDKTIASKESIYMTKTIRKTKAKSHDNYYL